MSGKMALQIPKGLWTAAAMVTLVVLSAPVAEGRDAPRECRAAAPQSHQPGDQALRDPWAGAWADYDLRMQSFITHSFSLGKRAMLHSLSPSKVKVKTVIIHQMKPGDVIWEGGVSVDLPPLIGKWVIFEGKNFSKEDTAGFVLSGSSKILSRLNIG